MVVDDVDLGLLHLRTHRHCLCIGRYQLSIQSKEDNSSFGKKVQSQFYLPKDCQWRWTRKEDLLVERNTFAGRKREARQQNATQWLRKKGIVGSGRSI